MVKMSRRITSSTIASSTSSTESQSKFILNSPYHIENLINRFQQRMSLKDALHMYFITNSKVCIISTISEIILKYLEIYYTVVYLKKWIQDNFRGISKVGINQTVIILIIGVFVLESIRFMLRSYYIKHLCLIGIELSLGLRQILVQKLLMFNFQNETKINKSDFQNLLNEATDTYRNYPTVKINQLKICLSILLSFIVSYLLIDMSYVAFVCLPGMALCLLFFWLGNQRQ